MAEALTPTGVKTWRWTGAGVAAGIAAIALHAQVPEISLPRPGAVVVTQVTGEAFATADEVRKPVKPDERVRVGSTITTGRRSMVTVTLSNGTTLQIGSESEVEIEEFGQAPFSGSAKVAEMKEEPSLSRTRLRLVRGDVQVEVKPLKVARGSSLTLATPAGTARVSEGTIHARLNMSDLGLGVCTVELQKGAAEFEIIGASYARVPLGQKLAFALEVEKATGVVKVGAMPKENPKAK